MSRPLTRRLFALGALLGCFLQAGHAQSKPLLMEHADSLSVERGRGFLLLQGGVRFRHDSIRVLTEKAMWNKNADVVQCEGGFTFLHPKGSMRANSGEYRRKTEIAEGVGSVVARDTNGEAAYFGERAFYNRKTEFLDLISQPMIHRYTYDSTKKKTDTLSIKAKRITYDKQKNLASAFGTVRIKQGDLQVTCDTGWFDKKNNKLLLVGRPKCRLKENQLSGDSMHIVLDGEKLKTVRVVQCS